MTLSALRVSSLVTTFLVLGAVGCKPGYIKAEDLESYEQGPRHCAMRCEELGMEMGALVLSSNSLPSCACVPKGSSSSRATAEGASAVSGAYVIAQAAAVAEHQRQQQMQQQAAANRR